MKEDLIERLRCHANGLRMLGGFAESHLPEEAADEIEHLRAELAALKVEMKEARLENIIKFGTSHPEMYAPKAQGKELDAAADSKMKGAGC